MATQINRSRQNKGIASAAVKRSKDHKIDWSKVDHGPPPIKRKKDWVARLLINQVKSAPEEQQ